MNKIKALLAALLTVSSASVFAHNNKTFLMPRPSNVNLAMEYTTFARMIDRHAEDKFGANFQVVPFWMDSSSSSELGTYFSCCGKACDTKCDTSCSTGTCGTCSSCCTRSEITRDPSCCGTCNCDPCKCNTGCKTKCGTCCEFKTEDVGSIVKRDGTSDGTTASTPAAKSAVDTVDWRYIVHDHNKQLSTTNDKTAKICTNPDAERYGARFDYYQSLDKLLKGLYFYGNMTIEHVEHKMNMFVQSDDETLKKQLENYYSGAKVDNKVGTADTNCQKELCKLRIDRCGCKGPDDETGVSDIDLGLGYHFLYKDDYRAALAFAITIPTGNDPDGRWLFESVQGNGNHFGVGFDFKSWFKLWGDDHKHNLKLDIAVKYRYLFESCENRALGIECPGRPCSPWYLVAKDGDKCLTPFANVSTCLGVDVTPGSQVNALFGLSYTNCGFVFDFGYTLYYREQESVKLKCGCDGFPKGWHLVARNAEIDQTNGFSKDNQAERKSDGTPLELTSSNVNTRVAETPSQFSNKIYGGLGYFFHEWEYPLMMGLGGQYEWASSNSNYDNWGIWGKVGVSF
ncbi:MAG: hypothetical protein H6679_04605 [Epsilonproteobacteria bacterium]|nr:hypothetical protein [Campylobacterota bacterium]